MKLKITAIALSTLLIASAVAGCARVGSFNDSATASSPNPSESVSSVTSVKEPSTNISDHDANTSWSDSDTKISLSGLSASVSGTGATADGGGHDQNGGHLCCVRCLVRRTDRHRGREDR